MIGEALKANKSLTKFDFGSILNTDLNYLPFYGFASYNEIEDEGGKAIGEALKTCASLKELNLNDTIQMKLLF